MRSLWHGQEPPAQGLILHIILAQRQGRYGLGHLVAQVEGMGGINWLAGQHLLEQVKRVRALKEHLAVEHMQQAALGKETEVAIAHPSR